MKGILEIVALNEVKLVEIFFIFQTKRRVFSIFEAGVLLKIKEIYDK